MSATLRERVDRLSERIDGRLNPILVKEAYQGLRSRWFTVAGLLALVGPLLVYLVLLVSAPGSAQGDDYFQVILAAMAFVGGFVIPLGSNRLLHSEITSRTLELVLLTPISSWRLVSGFFQGALLRLSLVVALLGPFAVSALLMGGVSTETVVWGITVVIVLGVMGCALALLGASLAALSPILGRLSLLAYILMGFMSVPVYAAFTFGRAFGGAPAWTWQQVTWLVAVLLALSAFMLRLSADILKPPGIRSYRASKLVYVICVPVYVAPLFLDNAVVQFGHSSGDVGAFLSLPLLATFLLAAFWSGAADERPGLTGRWPRLLWNGFGPTLLYAALVTAILALAGSVRGQLLTPLAWWGFLLFAASVTLFVWTLLPRRLQLPHMYVAVFIVLLAIDLMAAIVYGNMPHLYGTPHSPLVIFMPVFVLMDQDELGVGWIWFFIPPALGSCFWWLAQQRIKRLRTQVVPRARHSSRAPKPPPAVERSDAPAP